MRSVQAASIAYIAEEMGLVPCHHRRAHNSTPKSTRPSSNLRSTTNVAAPTITERATPTAKRLRPHSCKRLTAKSSNRVHSASFKHRDKRALVLYLLIRCITSSNPWDVALPAAVWARTLDLNPDSQSAKASVSKALRRLRDLGLIETARRGRRSEITVLHESGNGKPYTHPGAHGEGFYFKLPHAFFHHQLHQQLDLPAIAMLLVLLSRPPGEPLPVRKVEIWYGISAATAEHGLQQLREHGIVISNWVQKPDALDERGYRFDMHHRLLAPFHKNDPQSNPPRPSSPSGAGAAREQTGHELRKENDMENAEITAGSSTSHDDSSTDSPERAESNDNIDGPKPNLVVIAALLFIAILATISIPGALLGAVLITIVKAISSR